MFLAIECKAAKGTVTALQDREMDAIQKAGGVAVLVNNSNIDMVLFWVRTLKSAASAAP
jgi:hypothetical protein